MARKKYGEDLVAGIRRNMAATGYVKPVKPAKPIGYFSRATWKYMPEEMAKTTKRFAGAPGRAVGRAVRWGSQLKKKLRRK